MPDMPEKRDDSAADEAANEADETEETADGEASQTPAEAKKEGSARRANLLSRPTDYVARPGFRNPANARTKAQKSAGKKRR